MKIAIGCDEAACGLRDIIKAHLSAQGHEVSDFGTFNNEPVLYPDVGSKVAEAILAGQYERGILLCGTGIGMAISALMALAERIIGGVKPPPVLTVNCVMV